MPIQIDYFLAPDDEAAERTAQLEAGPRSESSDVVPSNDVDPGLALGYLNTILTGQALDDFLAEFPPRLIATSQDEQKLVLEMDDDVVARLAAIDPPLDELAKQWAAFDAPAEAEEWNPRPRDLVEFLDGITALAQRCRAETAGLYCWLWP